MDVCIVVIEDRDAGVDALPFSGEDEAVRYARSRAGHDGVEQDELPSIMREDGCVLCLPMCREGGRMRVIRRAMDAAS